MQDVAALADELEGSFLAKYARYEEVIADSPPMIRERLRTAVRKDDPFPHVVVGQLLPDALYAMLTDAWPPVEFFWSDRPNRMDLVTKPAGTDPSDARADRWDELPACIRRVWDFFVRDVNRHMVGPFVQEMFEPEIRERLALIERASADGVECADYLRPPFRPHMNVGRLMMRSLGYKLNPHVDSLPYLATVLYYFPQSDADADGLGTTLYRVDDELAAVDLFRRGKTEYFHKAGITTHPAVQVPFAANTLLAFANTARSAHGMHITTEGPWRRAFQSHLSLKSDFDHL